MKINIKHILFLISLVLFAIAAVIGYMAASGQQRNHLAILPKLSGNKSVSIKKAEELNEKFILTYESIYQKSVRALQVNKAVTLKGTNYTYPFVMGHSLTNGGFFTKEAQDNSSKVAVLNEKTSFELFGTLQASGNEIYIDMKPYIVVGVICDKDTDNLNVYVPVSSMNELMTESVIVSLNGISEEYAINEFKSIGINDMTFDFLNLELITQTVIDKTLLSAGIAVMWILIIILKKSLRFLLSGWLEFKKLRQEEYLKNILYSKSGIIFKLAAIVLFLCIVVTAEFFLLLYTVQKFLIINTIKGIFNGIVISGFTTEITRIQNLYLTSNIFFTAFIAVFTVFAISILSDKN